MKISKSAVAVACGAVLLGTGLLGTSTASAEPADGQFRPLAGVGSDTTENVMNALSEVITIGGNKQIANYNASGGGTIVTQSGCTAIARPNGSGAGRTALLNSLNANAGAGNGCLQFSRSSSGRGTVSTTPDLTWIPFASDALTFAVRSDSDVLTSLSTAEVIAFFKCQDPAVKPVLPQTGSGTRASWLGFMGITEADITAGTYPCLTGAGTATSRSYQQENSATTLKTDEITVYSMAQYQTQASKTITDVRGKAVLGVIDNTVPTVTNSLSPFTRTMYNLVPTARLATTSNPEYQVFATNTSLLCQQSDVIKQFGFLTIGSTCGDTSVVS